MTLKELIIALVILTIGIKLVIEIGKYYIANTLSLDYFQDIVAMLEGVGNLVMYFLIAIIVVLLITYILKRKKTNEK